VNQAEQPGRGNIKGSNIVMPVKALRMVADKARAALPESAHRYLVDRILVSSWYPEADGLAILKAYVRLAPGLGKHPYVNIGRVGAHQHARETYKHLVEEHDMERSLANANGMWRSYHDTGTLVTTRTSPNEAELELTGYLMLCAEWCDIIRGYFEGITQATTNGGATCDLVSHDSKANIGRWRLRWTLNSIG
jgi:hypothetical protein